MLEYLKKLEPIFKDVIEQYKINNLIKLLQQNNKQEDIISFVKDVIIDTLEEDCNQFIKENLYNIDLGIDENTLLEFMMFWEKKHCLWHIYKNEFIDYYPYYYILLDSLLKCASVSSLFQQQVPFEIIDREIFKTRDMRYVQVIHSTPAEDRQDKLSAKKLFCEEYYKPNMFIYLDALHFYCYLNGCEIIEKIGKQEQQILSEEKIKENYYFFLKNTKIFYKVREIFQNTQSVYMFDKSLCWEKLQKRLKSCRDLCCFMYKQDIIPEDLQREYKLKVGNLWF